MLPILWLLYRNQRDPLEQRVYGAADQQKAGLIQSGNQLRMKAMYI